MDLILTNKDGDTLDLLNNDNRFILTGAEGMHGIDTDIQEVSSPYLDGTIVEGVKALPRGIKLTFALVPDIKASIDFFTNIVKSKQYVTLTETENGESITIKGIAKVPPYTRMASLCKIELEIYCSQPYWEDINAIVGNIAQTLPMLFFPASTGQYFTRVNGYQGGRVFSVYNMDLEKTFHNTGDVSVGMNIRIIALGQIINPRISCESGDQNGWWMQVNVTLNQGDEIEINTTKGNKYIKLNGIDTYEGEPLLNFFEFNGYDWLQMETGDNIFKVTPTSADLYFTISYKGRYE